MRRWKRAVLRACFLQHAALGLALLLSGLEKPKVSGVAARDARISCWVEAGRCSVRRGGFEGLPSPCAALEAGDLPDLARVTLGQVSRSWLSHLMFIDFCFTKHEPSTLCLSFFLPRSFPQSFLKGLLGEPS